MLMFYLLSNCLAFDIIQIKSYCERGFAFMTHYFNKKKTDKFILV